MRPAWQPPAGAVNVFKGRAAGDPTMAEQLARLGIALAFIALISLGLYQFSGRASAVEPRFDSLDVRR